MVEWAIALVVFILAFIGMALGVLRGRRSIQGSCGGLSNLPGVESDCEGACRAACKQWAKQEEEVNRLISRKVNSFRQMLSSMLYQKQRTLVMAAFFRQNAAPCTATLIW